MRICISVFAASLLSAGTAGGIEHHTVTRLVQRASPRVGSAISASRLVFEGLFPR
jgi:hypothetical protein